MKRLLLWSSVFALACSSNGESFDPGAKTDGGPGAIVTGADGPCGTREDKAGCACTADGESRECWPGPVGQSHAGLCRSGVQVCGTFGSKEFVSLVWGACTGFALPPGGCGTTGDGHGDTSGSGGHGHTDDGTGPAAGFGGKTNDGEGGRGHGGDGDTDDGSGGSAGGHTDDGPGGSAGGSNGTGGSAGGSNGTGGHTETGTGGAPGDAPCGCQGHARWCDDPVFCNWGQQTCLPDGNWGPCQEVKGAAPAGCEAGHFNGSCCEQLGLCCDDNGTLFGTCQTGGCP